MDKIIEITGSDLTLQDFIDVCRYGFQIKVTKEAYERIELSRQMVDDLVKKHECVYGVTTGFGCFSNVNIENEDCALLQRNLIMSHAVGIGNQFDKEIVRGMILLRINNLAKGYSGVRPIVVKTLVEMLNRKVHPCVPEKGSLGASGDLVPMAHSVLPMIGLGYAEYQGKILPGKEAMEQAGIPVIELMEKEGLACINGTQAMTSVGAFVTYDAIQLMKVADIAVSLSFEALQGVTDVLDRRVHLLRPHQGEIDTADILLSLLKDSKFTTRQGELRVQDGYSLRCAPQVHGASKDTINYVKEQIEIEMNSVTDNPIVFIDSNEVISAGNFHGQPIALSMDFMGIALAEIANISERRIERLVNSSLNNGLPCFLVKNGGLNSGFMIVQYAAAALVSENKVITHPASVDSIPSSCNQEDHVSMGTISARKAREILGNTRKVLSMELLCSCQGIDLRGNKELGQGTMVAYDLIRTKIPELENDREMYVDINKAEALITSEELVSKVESVIGNIAF